MYVILQKTAWSPLRVCYFGGDIVQELCSVVLIQQKSQWFS
jgi:hypothetical protein